MAITHEDIQELKKVLDDRYVLQSDCDATQQNINNKLANNDKRIDSIKTSPNKALEAFLQANAAKDVLQMLK